MDQPMGSAVVATDNYAAGYKLGSYMKQFVKADSVIGIVGHVKGSSTAVGREAGFRAGLGEAGTQVAEIVFCDSDSDKAYEQTKDLLKKYPSMDLIVGLNEYSAVGAARAVRNQGKTGTIHMGSIDSSIKQIQFLESGVFDALVVQKPFNMGYLSVETAGGRDARPEDRDQHRLRFGADHKREYVYPGEPEAALPGDEIKV